MSGEVALPLSTLFGFLLVLARVSGVIIFVPLPGLQGSPEMVRVILALGLSLILMPVWSSANIHQVSLGLLPIWVAAEFSFGLLIGVSVSFLLEGVQLAAQMIGLQAGYSFASTIDPSTQADSAVLQVITQLLTGFMFFALGFDRELIRVLAYSIEKVPAVAGMMNSTVIDQVIRLGSQIFVVGLRLAMPVLALLILMDLSFAVMGKVHAQFQVMSLSFPAKMLVGLGMLGFALSAFPVVWQVVALHTLQVLVRLLGR